MKIKFVKPKFYGKIKCTVHLNGKLGFSQAAIKFLKLNENCYIRVGINDEQPNDPNLYIDIVQNQDENSYPVNKAGNYYYINTKHLFDEMGVDYQNRKIIYDMHEFLYEGNKIYKLTKREIERKKDK